MQTPIVVNELASPPKPRLTLRVGIVGHRPDRLAPDSVVGGNLHQTMDKVLLTIRDGVQQRASADAVLYAQSPATAPAAHAILRALSSLAEGSDRTFAESALELGYELCSVFPFPQDEYAKDFDPPKALEVGSRERFERILREFDERSGLSRFAFSGERADEGAAYGAAGRIVVNQSDVLVAVWDGDRLGKAGGTEESIDAARQRRLPIVWIDAKQPSRWRVVLAADNMSGGWPSDDAAQRDKLAACIDALLRIAAPVQSGEPDHPTLDAVDPRQVLRNYYGEAQRSWKLSLAWRLFSRRITDGKWPTIQLHPPPVEAAVIADWQGSSNDLLVERLRPFYAWADQLANRYGDRYRSTFLSAFLLAAIVVGVALFPYASGLKQYAELFTSLEIALIGSILIGIDQGRKRHWHDRWLDYRLMAESMRHLRLVTPLGGTRPLPPTAAHADAYQPHAAVWYVRAVEREIGLTATTTTVDRDVLLAWLADATIVVSGQVDYHLSTATRSHSLESKLHTAGRWLIKLTLVVCGLNLLPWLSRANQVGPILTALSAFLPALGAALAGILTQAEVARVAKRSAGMRASLDQLLTKLTTLQQMVQDHTISIDKATLQATDLAEQSARLMVQEALDWRVIFVDQPLRPPG